MLPMHDRPSPNYQSAIVCVQRPKEPVESVVFPEHSEWRGWHAFLDDANKFVAENPSISCPTDNVWIFPAKNGDSLLRQFRTIFRNRPVSYKVIWVEGEPQVYDGQSS
jgi:hypothetical protein